MMTEAQQVAEKLGVTFRVSLEKRIAGAERVGAHKTSMLQDVEHGRAIEIEALVGSVVELGRMTGHADAAYRRGLRLRQPAGEDARGSARTRARRARSSRDGSTRTT